MRRRGFTLIELLMTILIIGILSGLFYGAIQKASGVSKIAHTKSTIAKLNVSLMDRWDSYRGRRLPLDPKLVLAAIKASGGSSYPYVQSQIAAMSGRRIAASGGAINAYPTPPFDPLSVPYTAATGYANASQIAAVRLLAVRELTQYEMPQGFADVLDFSSAPGPAGWPLRSPSVLTVPPPIAQAYATTVNRAYLTLLTFPGAAASDAEARIRANDSAECLYMILTIGSTDSGLFGEQLPVADVGDVDGDGLLEFQDAWPVALNSYGPQAESTNSPVGFPWWAQGKANSPIDFLRWAPGYVSDVQPDQTAQGFAKFSISHHDYFDPLKLDIPGSPATSPRGFQLTPLIFSAGPNGLWAIDLGPGGTQDPYDATVTLAGTPTPVDAAADNLTNHELDTRTGR